MLAITKSEQFLVMLGYDVYEGPYFDGSPKIEGVSSLRACVRMPSPSTWSRWEGPLLVSHRGRPHPSAMMQMALYRDICLLYRVPPVCPGSPRSLFREFTGIPVSMDS